MPVLDPDSAYIRRFFGDVNPVLDAVEAEVEARDDTQPHVGLEVARLLQLLVRMLGATRVLEIGTGLGYAAVALADALRDTGGTLVTVERNAAFAARARERLDEAGHAERVQVLRGDAAEVLPALTGPFDLVLQDGDKALYPALHDRCVELLRPGGMLAVDDALFQPRGVAAKFSRPVDAMNRAAFADERLFATVLPVGDGVLLAWKRSG